MGQVLTDTVSDPNSDKRFRLVADEEGAPPAVPLPQGAGQPPEKPPIAPPAAVPQPEPHNPKRVNLEIEVMELKKENDELICALYYLQQELKDLRDSK
jgi:hypothetical protein